MISRVPFNSHAVFFVLKQKGSLIKGAKESQSTIVQIISDWFVCVYLSVFLLPSSSIHLPYLMRGSDASTQTPPDKYYITSQQ